MLYTFLPEEPCDMLYPPPPAGKAPWHDLPPPSCRKGVCDMLHPLIARKAP